MSDLISRQAAIDAIDRAVTKEAARWSLQELPSAERRGRWKYLGGDEWCCTACAHVITTEGSWERPWQKYCEECGARMEVE